MFSFAGRFRFIQVLKVSMLGTLKVFRQGQDYVQVPFKTGLNVLVKYFQAFSKLLIYKFSAHNHFFTFRLLPKNTNIKIFFQL